MRLTGFDFYADGRRAAVCTWDGDVWLVDGLDLPARENLTWQRIASGLFQPLGLKIVDGQGLRLLPRSDRHPARPQRRRRDRLLRVLQQRSSGDGALPRIRDGPADRRGRQFLLRRGRPPCSEGPGAASRHAAARQQGRLENRHPGHGLSRPQRRVRQPGRHLLSDRSGRLLAAEEPHQPRRDRRLLRQLLGLPRRDRLLRRGDGASRCAGSPTPSTARRRKCSGSRAIAGARSRARC